MPEYRRYYVPGGTFFFTCTTHCRSPILVTELARRCLREAITAVQTRHPFEIVAIVLVPDHWHTIWTLPHGDERYPMRWSRIKQQFPDVAFSAEIQADLIFPFVNAVGTIPA